MRTALSRLSIACAIVAVASAAFWSYGYFVDWRRADDIPCLVVADPTRDLGSVVVEQPITVVVKIANPSDKNRYVIGPTPS